MNNNSGSKLMNLINKIGTAILINLLFLVGCIPIVTIGASWSGLYSAIRFMIRGESWFAGYKEGFKTGLLRNCVATVYGLAVAYYTLSNLLPAISMLVAGAEVATAWGIIIISGIFLLTAMLFLSIMVPVNLYIRTGYDRWLKNIFYLIGHAPLQCLIVMLMGWFPVFQLLFMTVDFIIVMIGYVAIYFLMAGLIATVLLRKPLIRLLTREREEGTLLDED